jgi:hypothetical protein
MHPPTRAVFSNFYSFAFLLYLFFETIKHISFDQKEKSKTLKIAGVQCQKWLEEKYKEGLKGNSIKNNEIIINRLKR